MFLLLGACAWMSDADLAHLRDADGDGAPVWDDCDDDNAAIGVAGVRYTDADDDGYGGVDAGTGCPEAGTSLASGDCDDTDPDAWPGAPPDTCAGTDADCDGRSDADIDFREVSLGGPGHDGTAADTPPEGLGSALAYGVVEGAGQVVAAGSPTETLLFAVDSARGDVVYDQSRQDRFAAIDGIGDSIAIGAMFVDLDDPADVAVGGASWAGGGVVAILDIPSSGGDYGVASATATWTGAAGDQAGASLAFVEGVSGVVSSLLYVGGPGADGGRGAAWILSLGASGEAGEHALEDVDYGLRASAGDTDLGLGTTVGSWFDDTGAAYLTAAAPGWDASARPDAGAVFVAGFGASDATTGAVATWVGPRTDSRAASALAHEDLDGDGRNELIVGVEGATWGANAGAGAVYVIDGAEVLSGGELADAGLVLGGEAEQRGLGRAVLVYHPTDGPPTLLLSSHDDRGCGDFGAVWRWRPDVDGASGTITLSDAYYRLQGELGSELGASLAEGGGYTDSETIDWVWAGAPAEARVAAFAFTAER